MQRSGVWTQEEEEYAEAVVAAFHQGHLDIQEGRSLRKFLAERLMCSPKRVSKKYEGSNYKGKQTYRRSHTVTIEQIAETKQALSSLEQRFLNAAQSVRRSQPALSAPTHEDIPARAHVLDPSRPVLHQADYSGVERLLARQAELTGMQPNAAAPNAASSLSSEIPTMLRHAASRQRPDPLGFTAASASSYYLGNDSTRRSAGLNDRSLPEHLLAARMQNEIQGQEGLASTRDLLARLRQQPQASTTTQANAELFHRPMSSLGETRNVQLTQMGARWPFYIDPTLPPPYAGLPAAHFNASGTLERSLLGPMQARAHNNLAQHRSTWQHGMATQLPFLGGSLGAQDNLASNIRSASAPQAQNTTDLLDPNVVSAPAPSTRRGTSLVMREVARRDKKRNPRGPPVDERKRASDDDDEGARDSVAKRQKRGR